MRDLVHPPVPVADPVADNRLLAPQLGAAAAGVISGGPYILGGQTRAFETAFAHAVGAADAVGTASGTDALVLALLAAGVGPGDEVVAPSHTAGPTVAAILMTGATPVLVDIDPDTYTLSSSVVEPALGPKVKAVIVVHLYGQPADMDALLAIAAARGLALIEDCAQACGAMLRGRRVGGLGTAGCFSFYPTKNLGALGDGGCVVSGDTAFLDRVRSLRTYGWKRPQYAELAGGRCSRLDEIQAAMLQVKLPALDDWNARRRQIAARYLEAFADLPLVLPTCPADRTHVYHLFVVRSDRRDALEQHLNGCGIGTGRHYPFPTHRQPGLADRARLAGPLLATERIVEEIVSLPLFYAMTDEQADRVVEAVRAFFSS